MSKGKMLSKEEAMAIIAKANERSLKIRKGEIVPRVIRVADRGETAHSIRIIDLSAPKLPEAIESDKNNEE